MATQTQAQTPTVDSGRFAEVAMEAVDSSVLTARGYVPETGTVVVEYRSGTRYAYTDVAADEWDAFRRASSAGTFLNQVIKRYPDGTARPAGRLID